MHDLRFVIDGEVTQIDHLILNQMVSVFLLETKNYACNLVINERGGSPPSIETPALASRRRLSKACAMKKCCANRLNDWASWGEKLKRQHRPPGRLARAARFHAATRIDQSGDAGAVVCAANARIHRSCAGTACRTGQTPGLCPMRCQDQLC